MEPKYFESLYPVESWDNELEKIVGYIKEGNSSQLIGLPGAGRSNVLGVLAYNKEIRLRHFPKHHGIVHFVMVNFSEVRRRPYSDVLKFMFLSLATSLHERAMTEEYEKIDGLFKNALSYNDELVFSQQFKHAIEYLAVEKKLTVVMLMDKFDEYIPQVTDDFFIFLQSLEDKAKYRFSAIFSVSRPLEETLEPQILSEFSDSVVGHQIYLPLLDQPSVGFRISYLEKLVGKKLTEAEKKEIIRLTGGHMRLLMVGVEAYVATKDKVDGMADFLLSQKTMQIALKSMWQSLTPEEQSLVILVSETHPESIIDAGHASMTSALKYLQLIGIIKNTSVTVPLLKKANEQGLFKGTDAKLAYDEATNTIKKGEVTVSDALTKGEFRLLRYLLQHQGEIVERETIITIVWQEDKSSLGITDQAIDQLIFRLRRKIEEDPNHPVHLQTIKGRGIKYVS